MKTQEEHRAFTGSVCKIFGGGAWACGDESSGYVELDSDSTVSWNQLFALSLVIGHNHINIENNGPTPAYSEVTPGEPGNVRIVWEAP